MDGATVVYGSASQLKATLEYDFSQEKEFSYKNLMMDEIIHHLALFIMQDFGKFMCLKKGGIRENPFVEYKWSRPDKIYAEWR